MILSMELFSMIAWPLCKQTKYIYSLSAIDYNNNIDNDQGKLSYNF